MVILLGLYWKIQHYSYAIDHRRRKIEVPVRSPVLKPPADWLVVGWVTTSESQLLIVFVFVFALSISPFSLITVAGRGRDSAVHAVRACVL